MSKHHISDEFDGLGAVGIKPGCVKHGRQCNRLGRGNRRYGVVLILNFILVCLPVAVAQTTGSVPTSKVAVKTNLFYDAAVWTVNLGAEFAVAPDWTIDVSANYNGWTDGSHRKWKHWLIQPEARWWFGGPKTEAGRAFGGHFLPVHVHGGQFNFGNLKNNVRFLGTDWSRLTNERFQGWFFGVGIGYGYSFLLGRHWSLEAEIGIGYSYTRYDAFPCADCGRKSEEDQVHHYIGPTKLAVNLIYAF